MNFSEYIGCTWGMLAAVGFVLAGIFMQIEQSYPSGLRLWWLWRVLLPTIGCVAMFVGFMWLQCYTHTLVLGGL